MPAPELLSSQGLRLDGRRPNELRRIRCKLGVFTQPDGSAYLEQGNTKVLAAVYGPHQAAKSKSSNDGVVVNCQYSMATFSTGERKNRPRGDRKSQEMSMHLRQALTAAIKTELYPRSQIDVYVEVLQADGGAYCACVNAATLALTDAGVPLRAYAVACSASATAGARPGALVDVGHVEEAQGGVVLTVASLPNTGSVALLEMSHRLHMDYFDVVMSRAMQGCRDIEVILDRAVREHLAEGWTKQDVVTI
ncbi:exosome complex component RRP41 isoform X2 [Plodia interpunctella]|uniref:exosome complex component RRP41 isoform X2 n=1 Tax=Plodia interpunctella TaxID=58824 RepID=UPI0023687028|nr:exosome complex component RRP41 isoform X2 [Plodia interpunctella]